MFPVVEKFVSINGEGMKAGELAAFIRFRGCNLACTWCDTMWANDQGAPAQMMSMEDILTYIEGTGVKNVTLTGGEPLLQEGVQDLLVYLMASPDLHVEVETNGSVSLLPYHNAIFNPPSFTMDWKLPGSGMETEMLLENLHILDKKDTLKFVIGRREDMERALELIRAYDLDAKTNVYLSTVFQDIQPADIVTFMQEENLTQVRLQLQMHKYIWSPETKGV